MRRHDLVPGFHKQRYHEFWQPGSRLTNHPLLSPFLSWKGEEKFLGDTPSAPDRGAKPLWTPQADVTLIYESEY